MKLEEARQAKHEAFAFLAKVEAAAEEAVAQIRKVCSHEIVVEAKSRWGFKRLCVDCGIYEDETTHGTGFHTLGDVPISKVSSLDFFDCFEGEPLEWGWCYGDRNHPEHGCPEEDLTKGDGTRCKNYKGTFDY